MTLTFTLEPKETGFAVCANGKSLRTPGGFELMLPSGRLAEAIAAEWVAHPRYSPAKMKLTALAYTAIDRIAQQKGQIVEVLMAYVDTDTLSYRATGSEELRRQQDELWNPVLDWTKKNYGVTWEVTSGVMPLEQPQALQDALSKRLMALDDMSLAAACMLASGYSSLALAVAVLDRHLTAEEAFRLSRLEEESQAEAWGRDEEAEQRAASLKEEILAAERFLRLLDAA